MQWRDLIRPVRAGTVVAAKLAVRRAVPPPPSTPGAYASPLQAEVRAITDLKRRFCTYHCTGCTYSAGTSCSLDQRLDKAITEREDPIPFLKGINERLSTTEAELQRTQRALDAAQKSNKPSSRVRLGVYYSAGAITLTVIWQIIKTVVFGIP